MSRPSSAWRAERDISLKLLGTGIDLTSGKMAGLHHLILVSAKSNTRLTHRPKALCSSSFLLNAAVSGRMLTA